MTDTRTFGRILGETARAAQQVHLQVLTTAGTDFESWVAFTLLAENDAGVPKAALTADLARRLDIERSTSSKVLDRLAEAGHVGARLDGGTELVELTPAGKTYLRRVREAVNQASHRLIGHLDKSDLETTMNVLRAVGTAASDLTATTPSSP
jgi:DNA-binding MarR family transcriptional regulator